MDLRAQEGKGRAGGTERVALTAHTTLCKTARGKLLCSTENAARCSVDLEEWDAGGGREVHEGGDIGIHTADSLVVQQKLTTL